MIIEDESILNENDKQYIETVVLGEHISFFWAENQAENDSKPYLYHTLIHRKTQQIHSDYANFFKDLVKKFAIKHKLECRVFLRGCINLSFPMKGKGTPHRDHTFPHRQVIIYLNKSKGGSTVILSDKHKILKTIAPKQFKMISFDGKYPHYQNYPKDGRRVVAVLTFI